MGPGGLSLPPANVSQAWTRVVPATGPCGKPVAGTVGVDRLDRF